MYENLMLALAQDYYLLAPDNPGFGASDSLAGGFELDACAAALLEYLDLLNVEHCFLFGHHTGASIAVQMVHQAPGRFDRLALSGPTLLDPDMKATLPQRAAPFPADADGAHLQMMWNRFAARKAGLSLALLQREVLSALTAGDNYRQAYQAVAQQDFEVLLRAITLPTLVFAGTEDVLYSQLEASYHCLQQGQMQTIPGAGGYVCDQAPQIVAQLLREFFADTQSG